MKFLLLLLIALTLDAKSITRIKRNIHNEYKMCVPEDILEYCNKMSEQTTKSSVKIICIPARDRLDCIDKINKREADFVAVDPEDMYVASKVPEKDFAIFEEIRTLEEPEAEFRYEAVVVVHKDLEITSFEQLKGLKSCHTGVGRNVGYKVPLTKLKNMGIIGNLNEVGLSSRENELKAFSNLFSKACIVGKWSPDPKIDKLWKNKYSNLCQLCEEPDKCDYPDKFSGYEGALRCLAHNGGDIAWTKVIYVKKFFGLPVGTTPPKETGENLNNFRYLCSNGTKIPIDSPPCIWAARPWQGYMANAAVVKTADELRNKIDNLDTLGHKTNADWLEKVLEIGENNTARRNKVISPRDYLDKANYTDILERDYGPPVKTIRFCVLSKEEQNKCQELSKGAFSRNVRPRFDCVLQKSLDDCLKLIRDNGADVITLDAGIVDKAVKKFNLKPIIKEEYKDQNTFAVAVIHKNSSYHKFEDLKKSKACFSGFNRVAGYKAPLLALIKQKLIDENNCPHTKPLNEYFEKSCLPGVGENEHSNTLCSLCAGNIEKKDTSTKCNFDSSESYSGNTGSFRCLVEGDGNVAFLEHQTILQNTDGNNKEAWASHLKSTDFELLCENNLRTRVDQYEKCNLGKVPPNMIVTSNTKSNEEIQEIQNALLSASELYTERPDWFKMFGSFKGNHDLLFKDSATGLKSINEDEDVFKEYTEVIKVFNSCDKI